MSSYGRQVIRHWRQKHVLAVQNAETVPSKVQMPLSRSKAITITCLTRWSWFKLFSIYVGPV